MTSDEKNEPVPEKTQREHIERSMELLRKAGAQINTLGSGGCILAGTGPTSAELKAESEEAKTTPPKKKGSKK